MSRILILGGGIGGIVTANELTKKIGRKHEIILIDRKQKHEFSPSFPWLMLGWRKPEKIRRDLSLLNKKRIKYVNEDVKKIDIKNKRVKASRSEFDYDYLVISLGAELDKELIPGFKENAHHMYDLESALKLKEALEKFKGGTIAVGVSRLPFKCPAAPYEAALLLDYYFRKKGMRDKLKIRFFTPEKLPMPVAGETIGSAVKGLLESRGIEYNNEINLKRVGKCLEFDNGKKIDFDLLVAVPPHTSPACVKDSGLTDESGWIPVNEKTLETKYKNVYAIGDITKILLPSGKLLPKAGVFAHGEAMVVANNILCNITGSGKLKGFDGFGSCFLETGYGKSAFVSGNFYAKRGPELRMKKPGRLMHLWKIIFEKYWLWKWF